LDTVQRGCTALPIVKQGDLMVVANVDNSRFVLGTASDQLIVHLNPNLPRKSLLTGHEFLCAGTTVVADIVWVSWNMMYAEEEHIRWCNRQVYYLADEPRVHFVWQTSQESLGLIMSHTFDDYSIKDCGVISALEVTQRRTDNND
jgi:hypothetical protein